MPCTNIYIYSVYIVYIMYIVLLLHRTTDNITYNNVRYNNILLGRSLYYSLNVDLITQVDVHPAESGADGNATQAIPGVEDGHAYKTGHAQIAAFAFYTTGSFRQEGEHCDTCANTLKVPKVHARGPDNSVGACNLIVNIIYV